MIFESHSQDDREWAIDFAELREQQTTRFQQAREREAQAISDISDRIAIEFETENLVATLTTQVAQKKKQIRDYIADRAKPLLERAIRSTVFVEQFPLANWRPVVQAEPDRLALASGFRREPVWAWLLACLCEGPRGRPN